MSCHFEDQTWDQMFKTCQAWAKYAAANGLTTSNCAWSKKMADYVKLAWSSKYKTFQLFDISKRLYRYLVDDLECLDSFEKIFGERADFQNESTQTLNILQNFHALGKIVATHLAPSYPVSLCAVVFTEGCCLLARSLVATASMCYTNAPKSFMPVMRCGVHFRPHVRSCKLTQLTILF